MIGALVFAQSNENRFDNFYIEVGGSGLYYSLNFERAIPVSKLSGYSYSAGITPLVYKSDFSIGFSASAKYYNNLNKSHQINYCVSLTYFTPSKSDFLPTSMAILLPVGYKYTLRNNRMYLGFTLNGIMDLETFDYGIWPGLSMGYNFNMRCKYCRAL